MMSCLYMVIIGVVASLSARLVRTAEEWMDLLMALILGIAGSFLGGILANLFGFSMAGDWLAFGLSVAFSLVLALVLVIGYEYIHAQRDDDYDYDDEDE